jgi:hypothetical protein
MSDPIKKFFMVYGVGQGCPRYEHKTRKRAEAEAQRLAKQLPGITFVVLAAVSGFHAERPPVPEVKPVKIEKPDVDPVDTDDIPF